jgi:DNA mismatch endonuclease (patch repair protein)
MPDVFTKSKRSEVMARIRSRGNRDTELALAGLLRAHGITGWRRHVLVCATVDRSKLMVDGRKRNTSPRLSPRRGAEAARRNHQQSTKDHQLTVRPDFVFPKARTAVFVDGCFWHGCPRHATQPKQHAAFWRQKLAGNRARDRRVNRALRAAGWQVVRIWEHELKPGARNANRGTPPVVRRIQRALRPRRRHA